MSSFWGGSKGSVSWRVIYGLASLSPALSSLSPAKLDRVLACATKHKPVVNQVELHPCWRQDALRAHHADGLLALRGLDEEERAKHAARASLDAGQAAALAEAPVRRRRVRGGDEIRSLHSLGPPPAERHGEGVRAGAEPPHAHDRTHLFQN